MVSQLNTVTKVIVVGQGDARREFDEWLKRFSFIESDRLPTLISKLRVAYIATMFRTHDEVEKGQKRSIITRRADINWNRDDMMATLARENLEEACNDFLRMTGNPSVDVLTIKDKWVAYVKCHKDDPASEKAALAELAGMSAASDSGKPAKQASPTKPATPSGQPRSSQSRPVANRQPAAKPAARDGKSGNGNDYTSEAIMTRLFGGQEHSILPVPPSSYIKGGATPETSHPVVETHFDIAGASDEVRQAWFDEIHSSGYCYYQVHKKGEWLPIPSTVPVRNRQREALLEKAESTLLVEQPVGDAGKGVPIEEMRRLKEEAQAKKKKRGRKK